MPRKQNDPPQENIDSILLALVRLDNIDPRTLDHYMHRIREEWTQGAREKILHLLNSRDVTTQNTAVHLLNELATEEDLEEIEEFIADPMVSDLAKLPIVPLLQKLGSEMSNEGIIDYLNDPVTAMQQMQLHILEGVERSEIGVQAILSDVVTLPIEKRLDFVSWLGGSNDPRAVSLLLPLLESQTGKVATAIIEALEQLGSISSDRAIPALNYLIATSSNRQLKQTARTTLGRLTMQTAPGTKPTNTAAAQDMLPVHEARISSLDGTGSQLMMIAWRRPDGLLKVVNVFMQDQVGIKDCYGVDEMVVEQWQQVLGMMNERSFRNFHIPPAYASAFINEARTLNKRGRHKLPIAFYVWRPLLDSIGVDDSHATVVTALSARPFDAETRALAMRGAELYNLREFLSWLYDPIAKLEPYMSRFATLMGPSSKPAGSTRKGSRKPKVKKPEAELNALIDEALDARIDDIWRLLFESRLRHQALLLHISGYEQEAQLAVAVASMLHPDSQVPAREQPFLRSLMSLSLEVGPTVMLEQMAEALDIDIEDVGRVPISFFDEDQ